MDATEAPAVGAGLPRRLLGHAGDVIFLVVALMLGWFLWPSSLGGCTTLTIVSGESMQPTYYTGDLVVSRCGEVGIDDVIVYSPPDVGGARVIHRVIGGNASDGWTMQGDNNDFVDPWEPSGPQVLGRAVLHLPSVGKVASILLSPMTWISLLLVALAIVLWPSRPEPAVAPDEEPAGAPPAEEPTEEAEPAVLVGAVTVYSPGQE